MKKIILILSILFSGVLTAQTFDFGCSNYTFIEEESVTLEIDGGAYLFVFNYDGEEYNIPGNPGVTITYDDVPTNGWYLIYGSLDEYYDTLDELIAAFEEEFYSIVGT